MAKSFQEVYDLYRANSDRLGDMSVQDFSRLANYVTGTQDFAQGEAGGALGLAKKGEYWINRGVNATGAPALLGDVGSSVFEAFGADPEFGRQVGEGLPRAVANFAPVMLAGAFGAPALVGAGALAATSALSGLTPYANEASTAEILAGFAAPAVGIGAMKAASPFVSSAVGQLSKVPGLKPAFKGLTTTLIANSTPAQAAAARVVPGAPVLQKALNTIPERIAGYVGDVTAATVGVEALNVGLGVKPVDELFTRENILANVFGAIPFSFLDFPAVLNPRVLDIQPVLFSDSPRPNVVDTGTKEGAARVVEYLSKAQELKNIKNREERQLARAKLAEEYEDVLLDPKFATISRPRREAIKQVALENPQKVQEEILKTLGELRQQIKALPDAETMDELIATVNALAETPIRHSEVRTLVEQNLNKGDTPQEAVQRAAETVINKAEASPVKARQLRKEVATDIKLLQAAGGARGGRPAGATSQLQERQAWLGEFFKANPDAEAQFSKFYKTAESQLPKNLPDQIKTDMSSRFTNSIRNFYDKVLEGGKIPFKGKEKEFKSYLIKAAKRSFKNQVLRDIKHVDEKGIVIKFDSLEAARAEADKLNLQEQEKVAVGEKPGHHWQVAKLTNKGGADRWRLQAVRNIQEQSLDFGGAGEKVADTSAAVPGETPAGRTVMDDLFDALVKPDTDTAKQLRARDNKGLFDFLDKDYAAGNIKSSADLMAAIGRFTKLKQETNLVEVDLNTPTGVKPVDETPAAEPVVEAPVAKKFVVDWKNAEGKMQVKIVDAVTVEEAAAKAGVPEGTTPNIREMKKSAPAPKPAVKVEEPKPTAEEKQEVAEVKEAVEEMTTVDPNDPDYAAWQQVMGEQMTQFVDNLTVDDVVSIVKKVPELKKEMMARLEGVKPTVEAFRKVLLEVARLPSNKKFLNEFMAQVQVHQRKQFRPLFVGPKGKGKSTALELAIKASQGAKSLYELNPNLHEAIRQSTGWLLGPDGRWRFEISDKKMATAFDPKWAQMPTDVEVRFKLGQFMKHDELFKVYPELKDYGVIIENDQSQGYNAYYDPIEKQVVINMQGQANHHILKMDLLHELQHAIQHIEDFSQGSSPATVDKSHPLYQKILSEAQKAFPDPIKAERQAGLLAYRYYFGEVEARAVERRFNMTDEELRDLFPFHPTKDGWILKRTGDVIQMTKTSAWHGSPHQFTRFLTEKIGSGEGQQVEGWGLYFAELLEVAKGYRSRLSFIHFRNTLGKLLPPDATPNDVMQLLGKGHFTPQQERVLVELNNNDWLGYSYPFGSIHDAISRLQYYDVTQGLKDAVADLGTLFKVDLLPDRNEFMSYEAFVDADFARRIAELYVKRGMTKKSAEDVMSDIIDDMLTGGELYRNLAAAFGSPKAASEFLLEAGIPGIRYLDGSSRKRGEGTENFVVFDENLVQVLEANGRAMVEDSVSESSRELQFSLEKVTSQVLRGNGWSRSTVNRVALPFLRVLREVLNVDGVQFGQLIQDVNLGGAELLGLSSTNGMARRVYLAASKAGARRGHDEQMLGFGFNLAHEVGHHIELAAKNGLLSPEAQLTRAKFTEWASANRGEWSGILQEFRELLPADWRGLTELEAMMRPENVEEFEASAHAIWSMGQLASKSDLGLFAATTPAPVRNWFRTMAQWARDLIGSIKTFLYKAPTEATKSNLQSVHELANYFQNIKQSVNEAYRVMAESSQMFGLDTETLSPLKVSELSYENGMLEVDADTFRPNLVGPTPEGIQDKALSWASRSMVYLEQLAKRYPMIANMAYSVMSAPWAQKAMTSRAMEPIFGRYDPLTGRTEIDPARRPMLEMLAGRNRANQLMSDIHRWENEFRMELPLNKIRSASNKLADKFDQLSPNEKQAVILWHEGRKRSLQVLNEDIVRVKDSDGVHVIGSVINDMVPGKEGYQIASLALKSLRATDPAEQNQLTSEWINMLNTGDPVIDQSNQATVLGLAVELNNSSSKLKQTLSSRPWYTPEIRVGSHLLRSYDKNGKQVSVDGYSSSTDLLRLKELAAQKGAVTFKSTKRENKFDLDIGEELEAALSTIENTMVRKLQDLLPPHLAAKATDYVDHMNLQGELLRLEKAHLQSPGLPVRRLAEGRENLNMVMGWQMYVNTISRVMSNRLARSKMRYELSKPELQTGEYASQIDQIKSTFENYMQRDSKVAQAITKWNAVYHLGFNVPTHMAELTQGLSTVLPAIVFQTGSVSKSVKLLMGVSKELGAFYAKKAGGKLMGKDEWQKWGSKDEQEMLEVLARRGLMDQHAFLESLNDDVANNLSIGRTANESLFGRGIEIAGSPIKAFADVSMNIYGSFTRWNSRLSAIAGYRLAREQGMTHAQAIESAGRFLTETTFVSGRAGRPPEFYKNSIVGATLYSLQRYALGWMGMYATHLKGAFTDSATLMAQQRGTRRQHAKAVATMTLVQFGLAGMLGLPFVGPLLTLLEERLGLDIRGRVYQTLGELFETDAGEGGYLADMIMRGSANALLERAGVPADFGARFNLSGLPGMNEFNGFDPGRVFGPTANVANSLLTAVTGAATGDAVALSKSVAPIGLRKAVEYFVHGDAITTKGTRLGLEGSERVMYALGATPRRIAKQRDAEYILERQRTERLTRMNKAAEEIARLLTTNPDQARAKYKEFVINGLDGTELQRDINQKMREFAAQVAQATVKQNVPKDIRSTVPEVDRKKAAATIRSMGLQLPPTRLEESARMYNETMQMLGQRPSATRVRRGRMADLDPWI